MPDQAIYLLPAQVFDGERLRPDCAVKLDDGRITTVLTADDIPTNAKVLRLDGILSPGFVDLQVNGGGDVMFNTDCTSQGLARITAAHRRFGTVRIMPTVITDAPEVLDRATEAIICAADNPDILGLHIEGPHISNIQRGTHDAGFIRPLDDRTMGHVKRLRARNIPVMITIAPETVSNDQIGALAATGAIVSIGHSGGSAKMTRSALRAGGTCFTHLFNAMSPMLNRAPGVVGAAINSDAYAGIICDGYHVADEMLGLAIRARPMPDRMFLVSDAMATVGGGDHFELYGQRIELNDGKLINSDGGLAGAHVTMFASLQRLVNVVGVGLADALRMATSIPFGLATGTGTPQSMLTGMELRDLIVIAADLDRHSAVDTLLPQLDAQPAFLARKSIA